ncbi:cellulase family glycosylhydrolase [Streptomyces thermocoprophilus]|uniref:Cellulase family glycosylhydrolase n=1 Tax=Streptomyces thermocoprophilus TaxID=78356 RepID=A0ABV5V831_9ACTN
MARIRRGHRGAATWAALLVWLTWALTATACAPSRPAPGVEFGIAYGNRLVWMSDRELSAALDDAVTVGARWVRADLSWADIQPVPLGDFLWWKFDRVVGAAEERGLDVLPVLAYTPPWARPAGCGTDKCAPADPEAFAAFAGAAARRYAPRDVHRWEVWNEPNIPVFWQPAPDPAAYTTLLRATSRAVRRADPSAGVVLGGLAAPDTSGRDISAPDFLAAVLARGGGRSVDAVGYHPYTYPALPGTATGPALDWARIDRTRDSLRRLLTAHDAADTPVWITEFGAPTNGPGPASDGRTTPAGEEPTHVTEGRQAQIAADAVRTARRTPLVRTLIWYTERDQGTDRSTPENFFGLRRYDGTAKPAFGALRDAIAAPHGG